MGTFSLFFIRDQYDWIWEKEAFQMQKPELKKGSPSSYAPCMSAGSETEMRVLEKGEGEGPREP